MSLLLNSTLKVVTHVFFINTVLYSSVVDKYIKYEYTAVETMKSLLPSENWLNPKWWPPPLFPSLMKRHIALGES